MTGVSVFWLFVTIAAAIWVVSLMNSIGSF